MSEYNIQMNKYNALNAEYDQLYPATKIENVDGLDTALQNKAPKTHASQHASGGADPITPAAIGAATAIHTHAAGDIISGILAISRGGTGVASLDELKTLLGISECKLEYGTYTGNSSSWNTNITLSFSPNMIIIFGGDGGSSDASFSVSFLINEGSKSYNSGMTIVLDPQHSKLLISNLYWSYNNSNSITIDTYPYGYYIDTSGIKDLTRNDSDLCTANESGYKYNFLAIG